MSLKVVGVLVVFCDYVCGWCEDLTLVVLLAVRC